MNWTKWNCVLVLSFCVHEKLAYGKLVAFSCWSVIPDGTKRTIHSNKPVGDKWKEKLVFRSHYCCPKIARNKIDVCCVPIPIECVADDGWVGTESYWVNNLSAIFVLLFHGVRCFQSHSLYGSKANSQKNPKFNWNCFYIEHALHLQIDELECFGCS